MRIICRLVVAAMTTTGVAFTHAGLARPVRAENLSQAWAIAQTVNQGLQSQQAESVSAGLILSAARAARLPTVRTFNFDTFLTNSPRIKTNLPQTGAATGTGTGGSSGGTTGTLPFALPSTFSLLGPNQTNLPLSISYVSIPLYTGGRLLRTIDQTGARVGAQRSAEFRTALDLRLTVAEAYVGVLRAQKALEVARSNVERLDSFARDVRNRREQGVALRADELASEVTLANARLSLIQTRTTLEAAWARYNRYLCRPLTTTVSLEELTVLPANADWKDLAAQAFHASESLASGNESEVRDLTEKALRSRPELAGLGQEARALAAQAEATRGGIRPQAGFAVSYLFLGSQNQVPQGIGAATFYVDWTISDGGSTRRRAEAIRQQEVATMKRRADVAADVALEVRTRWLDLLQSRQRVPVARLAIVQAEENFSVVTDRYRQQLSNYTEVLDAENRRVTSLNNFYNALYDENLATFRLRRAVGDL